MLLFLSNGVLAIKNIPEVKLTEISQQLLLAAKTREPVDSFISILTRLPEKTLEEQLITDDQKKAFWINIYNAYTQIILSHNPGRYKDRSAFFSDRQIEIAGRKMSLDDIEHGILRHSKIKWSLGYFNKLFPSSFEKNSRVHKLDFRIHFALNCGATSCPPIAFYKPSQIDKQLDMATKAYLAGESEYRSVENKIYVPALLGWFRRDFGGKQKIRSLLKKLSVIPTGSNPAIRFKKYDWNLFIGNYTKD